MSQTLPVGTNDGNESKSRIRSTGIQRSRLWESAPSFDRSPTKWPILDTRTRGRSNRSLPKEQKHNPYLQLIVQQHSFQFVLWFIKPTSISAINHINHTLRRNLLIYRIHPFPCSNGARVSGSVPDLPHPRVSLLHSTYPYVELKLLHLNHLQIETSCRSNALCVFVA